MPAVAQRLAGLAFSDMSKIRDHTEYVRGKFIVIRVIRLRLPKVGSPPG